MKSPTERTRSRTTTISIRLTPGERRILKAAAMRLNKSLGQFMREAAISFLHGARLARPGR